MRLPVIPRSTEFLAGDPPPWLRQLPNFLVMSGAQDLLGCSEALSFPRGSPVTLLTQTHTWLARASPGAVPCWPEAGETALGYFTPGGWDASALAGRSCLGAGWGWCC